MSEFENLLREFNLQDKKKMDDATDIARSLMNQDMNPVSRQLCLAGILSWKFRIESDNYPELAKKILYDALHDPTKGGASIKDWDVLQKETDDYYENGTEKGFSTGYRLLDRCYTLSTDQLNIITGIPTHGKSEFMDQIMMNTIGLHGWRWLVFSPENYPIKFHMDKLLSKYTDKPFRSGVLTKMTRGQMIEGMKKIREHIDFIEISEYGTSLDSILVLAKMRDYNGLIIDPWNEMENKRRRDQPEHDWIGENLSKVRRWARANNTGVWIVAHPTKMRKVEGQQKFEVPTAYDIKGSAEWYNRADNILTVYRTEDDVQIYIQKIKFKTHGEKGMVSLRYDRPTGIYSDLEENNG